MKSTLGVNIVVVTKGKNSQQRRRKKRGRQTQRSILFELTNKNLSNQEEQEVEDNRIDEGGDMGYDLGQQIVGKNLEKQ